MQDTVQESEVGKILNKRHEYFTPERGCFYRVNNKNKEVEIYAKLIFIGVEDFPYFCELIARRPISVDDKAVSLTKMGECRFDHSGISKDFALFTLKNLSKEEKWQIDFECALVDTFNRPPAQNVSETIYHSFYYNKPRQSNKKKRYYSMLGSPNKLVTKGGHLVLIESPFGSDSDFPMEGYIIARPGNGNNDSVVADAMKLRLRWSYSGRPAGYDEGDAEFNNYTLCNTPEDVRVVAKSFNKKYCVKSKSEDEKPSEKTENNDDMFGYRVSLLSKIAIVVNGLWSTKSGKFACFVLAAWVVNFVFGCEISVFLNSIIPAFALLLAVYSVKTSLKM